MSFMAALDPSAELPWTFNNPFQPRPDFTYSWLLRKASREEAEVVLKGPVAFLEEYAAKMDRVVKDLERESKAHASPEIFLLSQEPTRALQVTALRAKHRALTIRALVAQRKRHFWQTTTHEAEQLLLKAVSVRQEAQDLVYLQERVYRYPLELVAREREDFTAYHFGYLYPVSNLAFWKRGEEQVRNLHFHALYLNIWNFRRIIGLESLCN